MTGTFLEGIIERQRLDYVKRIINNVACNGYCKIKIFAQDRNG